MMVYLDRRANELTARNRMDMVGIFSQFYSRSPKPEDIEAVYQNNPECARFIMAYDDELKKLAGFVVVVSVARKFFDIFLTGSNAFGFGRNPYPESLLPGKHWDTSSYVIDCLFVNPAYKSAGIMFNLLSRAVEQMSGIDQDRYGNIEIAAETDLDSGRQLYEGLNMTFVGDRKKFSVYCGNLRNIKSIIHKD